MQRFHSPWTLQDCALRAAPCESCSLLVSKTRMKLFAACRCARCICAGLSWELRVRSLRGPRNAGSRKELWSQSQFREAVDSFEVGSDEKVRGVSDELRVNDREKFSLCCRSEIDFVPSRIDRIQERSTR